MPALMSEMVLHDSQKLLKIVLVVEDDYGLREALEDTLALAIYSVVSAKNVEQAMTILSQDKESLMIVADINMGDLRGHDLLKYTSKYCAHIPVLLMTAFGSVRDSVDAIRNGAIDYLVKPFEPIELVDIVDRQLGCTVVNNEAMPIAEDEHSQQLLQLSRRVAQSNSTVLIVGESGTGKEVLARYIHQQSTRSKQVFIAINCAAIPENMLEAMLFGYEKGAYTGAQVSTPGKFEQANGGTLLLDEISEMDVGLQAKLLRVLQEREVERLGGRKTIALDVRVIATSNRDILKAVAEGKFREDLYYRLSVLPLVWKPLRERTKDILPLASLLLNKHSGKQKRRGLILSDSAQQELLSYPWPGNVRELDNVIQRALILQMGNVIEANDLGLNSLALSEEKLSPEADVSPINLLCSDSLSDNLLSTNSPSSTLNSAVGTTHSAVDTVHSAVGTIQKSSQQLGDNLQKREFEIIANTLREERGSRKNTANRLGISPRTLRYKLAKMRDMGLDA
jgi:two-component system response regulator FlrC